MWTTIGKVLLDIIIYLISDKVLVATAKKMIVKAVDSGVEGVGVTNEDAKDLIHSITQSSLNALDEHILNTL
jgi:hypothetical protein